MEDLRNYKLEDIQFEVIDNWISLQVNRKVASETLSKIEGKYEKSSLKSEAFRTTMMLLTEIAKPKKKVIFLPWKDRYELAMADETLQGIGHKILYAADAEGNEISVDSELLSNEQYMTVFRGMTGAIFGIMTLENE